MKKMIGIFVFMMLCVIGVYFIIASMVVDKYNEKDEALKELVGEEIVLKKDTLTIINYNTFTGNVTLDNGMEVDGEFAKGNMIED